MTTTLRIEHAITDFNTWRSAFDRFDAVRSDRGVLATRVHRPLDDDQYVLIDLEFTTVDAACSFEEFLHVRIWSTPANAPALAGAPITRILRDAGDPEGGVRGTSHAGSAGEVPRTSE